MKAKTKQPHASGSGSRRNLVASSFLLANACSATPDAATFADAGNLPTVRRPNIVFILTDDQDAASFSQMPNVNALLVQTGTQFPVHINTTPLCCPSRSSHLRGQYPHNHGVVGNVPPRGGYARFVANNLESDTVAVRLHGAGYRTALFGKYLNGYADRDNDSVPRTHVPAGWDRWASPVDGNEYGQFNYTLNEDGTLVKYGRAPADYLTDVISAKATGFIRDQAGKEPFFIYLAPYAPHSAGGSPMNAPVPAPRHAQLFPGVTGPRTLAFDEQDVSDKPAYVSQLDRLTPETVNIIDANHRARIQSLQAIDEMVKAVVDALADTGALDNTYILYTSDNGWMQGQHRLPWGKTVLYDESSAARLIVRGPGVLPGMNDARLTANIDMAPTFLDIAGASIPAFMDGRSLLPILRSPTAPTPWRRGVLIEDMAGDTDLNVTQYRAIRTADHLYARYSTGERELYDLRSDPLEVNSLITSTSRETLRALDDTRDQMSGCAGATCRQVEEQLTP